MLIRLTILLPNKMTDVCKNYRQGKCPHGRSGHRMVNGSSPRTCFNFKYMKYGADQQRGCTQGLECNRFRPVICQTSLQKLRFPSDSEHKSSQRRNGPSVGNSARDRVKKGTKLTLMKEMDFLLALLNQQEQFTREMKDLLRELVTQTRYRVSTHSPQRVARGT